jgi:hypothetical protein
LEESTRDPGTDRPGFDYSDFPSPSEEACASTCVQDPVCDAWTYRRQDSHCWLKQAAEDPSSGSANDSGRVTRELEVGFDRYGNDYFSTPMDTAQSCRDKCESEPECRAFAFSNAQCWLKSARGTPTRKDGSVSGFKGQDTQALEFADRDSRLVTSTGDWDYGSFKSECGASAVVGLSEDLYAKTAHAALCSDPFPLRYPHQTCRTLDVSAGDNRGVTSTGDWDVGFPKGECGVDEYVAGVAQRPNGALDSLLCCQGLVQHANCTPRYQLNGDSREDTYTSDWDNSYVKMECGPGRYVAGVARNTRSGQPGGPDAILCCDETLSAVWSGHLWTWNTENHPEDGPFEISLRYELQGSQWNIFVDSLSIDIGEHYALADGQIGTGVAMGNDATLTLPLHGTGYVDIQLTLPLSTTGTINWPNGTPATGSHVGNELTMVGQASDGSATFWTVFQGSITAWP